MATFQKNNSMDFSTSRLRYAAYQRPQDATFWRAVDKIVKHFDVAKLEPIIVSERDGCLWVVDGQHRVEALKIMGDEFIFGILLKGLSYEEEAERFRFQNKARRKVATLQMFLAGIEAKDEECLEVEKALSRAGYRMGSSGGRNNPFNVLNLVAGSFNLIEIFGSDIFSETLILARELWEPETQGKSGLMLAGLAEFVVQAKAADKYNRQSVVRKLKSTPLSTIVSLSTARTGVGIMGGRSVFVEKTRKQVAGVLAEKYSHGRTSGRIEIA